MCKDDCCRFDFLKDSEWPMTIFKTEVYRSNNASRKSRKAIAFVPGGVMIGSRGGRRRTALSSRVIAVTALLSAGALSARTGDGVRPIALPVMPAGSTFEMFVKCDRRTDPIAIRADGHSYALTDGRWRRDASCTRQVFPIYVTPSGGILRASGSEYRVALIGPILSTDAATRVQVVGPGARTIVTIAQRLRLLADPACTGPGCGTDLAPSYHAVAVEGDVLSGTAYLVVRSFASTSSALHLTLVPLSWVVGRRRPGALCVGNVAITWGGHSTPVCH